MLDLKFIRDNIDLVKKSLEERNLSLSLDNFVNLYDQRRKILLELEDLRSQKNKANEEISALLKEKKTPKKKFLG